MNYWQTYHTALLNIVLVCFILKVVIILPPLRVVVSIGAGIPFHYKKDQTQLTKLTISTS